MYLLLICIVCSANLGCERSSFDYASLKKAANDVCADFSDITVTSGNYADGVTPAKIEVLLKNYQGEPISNREVHLAISGDNNTLSPCSKTNNLGIAVCWLYTTTAERKRVSMMGMDSVWEYIDFTPIINNRNSGAIVAAGAHYNFVSGNKATVAAGELTSSFQLKDSFNKIRAETSILSRMPNK